MARQPVEVSSQGRARRTLAQPAAQVLVAGGDDVALVGAHPGDQAVVRVRARVRAGQAFEAGVLGDLQGDPVFWAQLFQFGQDAVGDAGRALGVQAVHHALDQVDL